jgi:hypothetical protein
MGGKGETAFGNTVLNCMFPSMTFSEKLEDLKMLNLPAEK